VSNRNEYRKYFLGGTGSRCVGLTILPPSCAYCLEIWEPQESGAPGPVQGLLYLAFILIYVRLRYDRPDDRAV